MQGLLDSRTHTFRVRLWVEPREVAGQPMRVPGEVEHLGTGRTRAITDGGELLRFIEQCLDDAGARPREGFVS